MTARLFASATVGEPAAPWSAPRRPPIIDEHTGTRLSAHTEPSAVLTMAVRSGCRASTFGSFRATEQVEIETRRRVGAAPTVRAPRGGYRPAGRREIEAELVSGHLRAGRAGRGRGRSPTVLEAGPGPHPTCPARDLAYRGDVLDDVRRTVPDDRLGRRHDVWRRTVDPVQLHLGHRPLDLRICALVGQAPWYVVDPGALRGPVMPAPATSGNVVVHHGYPGGFNVVGAVGRGSCVESPKCGPGIAPVDAGAVTILPSALWRPQEGPDEPPPAWRAVGSLGVGRVKRAVSPGRRPPRPPSSLVSTRNAS